MLHCAHSTSTQRATRSGAWDHADRGEERDVLSSGLDKPGLESKETDVSMVMR
jgi:hypothetical protein